MDKNIAHALLQNLLERAAHEKGSVYVTAKELEALSVYLDRKPELKTDIISDQIKGNIGSELHLHVEIIVGEDVETDALLCIDFGTSFSKAFASVALSGQMQLVDLPLGQKDGKGKLITPSEILIDGEYIYFGPAAREKLEETEAPVDRLIDSIKHFITLGVDVSKLGTAKIGEKKDPSGLFTKRDVLVLYLAHLTHLTETALTNLGHSRNIPRRFTHPAWAADVRSNNEIHMKRMMAEAIILARSAPNNFSERLKVRDARMLLDELRDVAEQYVPTLLVDKPIREATAAGAGALMRTEEGRRDPYLVVDIGAGTTDVAGFVCVNNPNKERLTIHEVIGAASAENAAGNVLDNFLQAMILEKSGLAQGSPEFDAATLRVRRFIRIYKEQLFDFGEVSVELPTGDVIAVKLAEFLNSERVTKNFKPKIFNMIAKSASITIGSEDKLYLIATGGGANLPFIDEWVKSGIHIDGKYIKLERRSAIPDWISDRYPDLIEPFPQIAVALGGALPELPQTMRDIPEGITRTGKMQILPSYKN